MAAQRTFEPSSLRLLKVPDAAPPFDGEALPADGVPEPEFDVWMPRPALPGPVPAAGPVSGRPQDDAWAGPFARLLTETLAGIRPMRQIAPWLTARAKVHLHRAVPVLRCGQRPRVLRVLVNWPHPSVAELSVIVGLGPRTKALAVRMEKLPAKPGQPPRWLCTDIETH